MRGNVNVGESSVMEHCLYICMLFVVCGGVNVSGLLIYLFVCQYICLYVRMCVRMPVCVSVSHVCPWVSVSVCASVCQYVYSSFGVWSFGVCLKGLMSYSCKTT